MFRELDFFGRSVLVTGGTRGLGRSIGVEFARRGARVVVTCRWGQTSAEEINAAYEAEGARPPEVVEADAGNAEDRKRLADFFLERGGPPDVFVSNVALAPSAPGVEEMRKRDLMNSLKYSAWPLSRQVEAFSARFGRPPARTIATTSDGHLTYYPGYHYVAASKSAVELIVSTLSSETFAQGGKVFGLRSRLTFTEGMAAVFGNDMRAILEARFSHFEIPAKAVGSAAVLLASGLLDGLNGRVLSLDKGSLFFDNGMTGIAGQGQRP